MRIAKCCIRYYPAGMATITCKISEKLNAQLEALARRTRTSKSALLREALVNKIKAERPIVPTAHDLANHLCGRLSGPHDLSTNPKYMEGFGE